MSDDYITTSELLALLAVFVGPFLLAGALAQYVLLRRAAIPKIRVLIILALTAIGTIVLQWFLSYLMRGVRPLLIYVYGGTLILPGILATGVTTFAIALYVRARNRKLVFSIGSRAFVVSVAFTLAIWMLGFVLNASKIASTLAYPAMVLLSVVQRARSPHDLDLDMLFVVNIVVYFIVTYLVLLASSRFRKTRNKRSAESHPAA